MQTLIRLEARWKLSGVCRYFHDRANQQSTCLCSLHQWNRRRCRDTLVEMDQPLKCVIIGAGPVGALAALYAARRGWDVEVYELRGGAYVRLGPQI